VSANPDGAACYRASIRATTGLDLSPDSVHQLGRARRGARGRDARDPGRAFGTTDVAALLDRLRSEPAYTFRSRDDMLAAARAAVRRATTAMPAWFGRRPKAEVVVEPYPAFRERESVAEWNPPTEDGSRPGMYFLSTYDPGHKSRADLEALTFHETIPGTTCRDRSPSSEGQRSLPSRAISGPRGSVRDGPNMPSSWPTRWVLYSSDTARLGALADITLSAALLVVDTGINAFGWAREQGIAYLRDHTRVPRLRAEVPVDRYPIWPAQGCPMRSAARDSAPAGGRGDGVRSALRRQGVP